jgi:hypothetical protein
MANQNNRGGDDAASSNTPAEPERKHKSGGHMGAGKSGGKSFGAEKPEVRDDNGSREAGRDWDNDRVE